MSDHHRIGGTPYPPRWSDPDLADAADDADDAHRQEADDPFHPENWPDVEWSADQTHAGEFGWDPMTGAIRD